MRWLGQRLRRFGWQIGPIAFGLEERRYDLSVSLPMFVPTVWRPRYEGLAPAPEINIEAFEEAAQRRRLTNSTRDD